LEQGFALAHAIGTGKYQVEKRHVPDARRAAHRILRILNPRLPVVHVAKSHVAQVWGRLAREYRAELDAIADERKARLKAGQDPKRLPTRAPAGGYRQTEFTIQTLFAMLRWLRDQPALGCREVLGPWPSWKLECADDWSQLTGSEPVVHRPRYTEEELGRLWRALPEADCRVRLLLETGAELRPGQVLRCTRRHLDLRPQAHAPLGELTVPGAKRKRGTTAVLTRETRDVIDDALTGHLREYEEAYQAGQIDNYPLFPAGRFRKGVLPRRDAPKQMTREHAGELFRELEQLAGVEHVPGRAWYGIRRVTTDIAPAFTSDERVLDNLSSNDEETRRRYYQDREAPRFRQQAAAVRDQVRRRARDAVRPSE
jgi:hypothetical protein